MQSRARYGTLWTRSELVLQSELQDSRIGRTLNLAERRRVQIADRVGEVDMVQPDQGVGVAHVWVAHDVGPILTDAGHVGFATINLDGVWLSTLWLFAAVAAELGDRHAARELFDLLEPFGTQFASDGAHVQGTVAQALGRLAAVLGRDDHAEHWFGAAEAMEGNMRAVLMQALTRTYWAEALAQRESTDDRRRARLLAEQARETALELGCAPLLERSTRGLGAA